MKFLSREPYQTGSSTLWRNEAPMINSRKSLQHLNNVARAFEFKRNPIKVDFWGKRTKTNWKLQIIAVSG